jgi:hypothetical protein
MTGPIAQLYAVIGQGSALSLQHLPMTGDLQEVITTSFLSMYDEFHISRKPVRYSPSYEPDPDEYFAIEDYKRPEYLAKSDTTSDTFPLYRPSVGTKETTVKAILAVITGTDDKQTKFLFQHFDRRRVLNRMKLTLLFRKNTFSRLDEPGIMIGDHLDAAIVANQLMFRSFFLASQFLPLAEYFHEANDDEIRSFVSNPLFWGGKADQVIASASQITRKRISVVLKAKTLDGTVTPHSLKSAALRFELDLKIVTKSKKHRIEFPQDQNEVRRLLHFLAEGMYLGPITGEPYITNSYRRMK